MQSRILSRSQPGHPNKPKRLISIPQANQPSLKQMTLEILPQLLKQQLKFIYINPARERTPRQTQTQSSLTSSSKPIRRIELEKHTITDRNIKKKLNFLIQQNCVSKVYFRSIRTAETLTQNPWDRKLSNKEFFHVLAQGDGLKISTVLNPFSRHYPKCLSSDSEGN